MGQLSEFVRRHSRVISKYNVNSIFLVSSKIIGVTFIEVRIRNHEATLMFMKESRTNRSIAPSLKIFIKERFFSPSDSPSLRVIAQLL